MPEPITPAVAAQAATHLTTLQELLHNLGLHTRLLTQDERLPRLRVINPEATTLSEVITAEPEEDQWLFWWSWTEPITEVAHLAAAADRICRVLATASRAPRTPNQRDTADTQTAAPMLPMPRS
ncbi:hypothetical protein ACFOY2_29150 [Nonomuraea purpurea]|uniref:Uncharacterized protein n=1 Tax=Nonomuraea purpurea TaxID=1849276 RepID=A0ABV8GBG7_9ACTN